MFLKKMGVAAIMLAAFSLVACSGKGSVDAPISPAAEVDGTTVSPIGGGSSAIDNPSEVLDDANVIKNVNSGDYLCRITKTEGSIKIEQRIENVATYISTATGGNHRFTIETELWYANKSSAEKDCKSWKEEAEEWDGSMTVECASNTVKISEYDEGSLDNYEKDFIELCDDGLEYYKSGMFEEN